MVSDSTISKQEIIDQLNRILLFPVFGNSMILSGFLRFIVEETLEGRGNLLKEYTIGTHVLSKKVDYDPQVDASVRIHAGRLRRSLHEYYKGPGCNDPVHISVPKGAYIPKFELIKTPELHSPAKTLSIIYKPTLAVLPFHCLGDQDLQVFAEGVCDQICMEFSNFDGLSVVSYYASRKIASEGMGSKASGFLLDATYLLTGSIQSNKNIVRIRVQLIQSKTQHQVWGCSYEKEKSGMDDFSIQDDIVKRVINQIGGSHGIILREAAKTTPIKHALNVKVYDAVFWYYYLQNDLNEGIFKKGLEIIKNTVQLDPQYVLGWAILGETYVAGFFYGYDCGVNDPLEEGVKCGQKALSLDPRCQHTYQTLSLAYIFQRKFKECLQIIGEWTKLKSNAAGISGGLGFCLICAGEYERGYSMLSESIQLNPYYQWWFNAGLSIYHFQKKEFEDALYWAEKIQRQSILWELILKAAAYAELEKFNDARICTQELLQIIPNLIYSLEPIVGSFLHSEELVNRLLISLRKVGL